MQNPYSAVFKLHVACTSRIPLTLLFHCMCLHIAKRCFCWLNIAWCSHIASCGILVLLLLHYMWLELYKSACSSHCEGICFWFFYIAFDFTMRYNSFAFSTLYVSHTMLNYALAIFSPLHVACTLQNRSYHFFVAYGLRFWNFPFVVFTVHVACTMHRILLLLFVHYMLITVCDNPFPIFFALNAAHMHQKNFST